MPGRDRTGPLGQGAMTGRGMGVAERRQGLEDGSAQELNIGQGQVGQRLGAGRGLGAGQGRGMGNGRGLGAGRGLGLGRGRGQGISRRLR